MLYLLGLVEAHLWYLLQGKKLILVDYQLNGSYFALTEFDTRRMVFHFFLVILQQLASQILLLCWLVHRRLVLIENWLLDGRSNLGLWVLLWFGDYQIGSLSLLTLV